MLTDNVDNTPDDTSTQQPSAPDAQATAPVANTDSSSDVNPGYAKAKASGAVKFTDVIPGKSFNGIVVPDNAYSTDGTKFYDKTGSALVDNPYDADGEPNTLSSEYISEWAKSALKKGVNPVIINEFIKPWQDLAVQTKDFEMKNSDNILMKQGLDADNKTKSLDLGNKYAATIGTSNPAVGLGIIQQLRNAKPAGAPDSPMLMQFGVQPTDSNEQALSTMQQSGPAKEAKAALQASQTGIAAATQGIQTSRLENAKNVVDMYTGENNNNNNLSQINQSVGQAKTVIDKLIAEGHDGGKVFNTINDIKNNFGEGSPEWASVKATLATLTPQEVRQAIGAGNRMGQTEFNVLSQHLSSGDMPLKTLSQQLGNANSYLGQQQKISAGKLTSYEGIAKDAKVTLPSRVSPPTNVAFPNSDSVNSGGKLTPPSNLSQNKFYEWANQNGISNKNAEVAWKRYSTSGKINRGQ